MQKVFLQCVSFHASSDDPFERSICYTQCIRKVFHHRDAFLGAFSNQFPEEKICRIVYKCLMLFEKEVTLEPSFSICDLFLQFIYLQWCRDLRVFFKLKGSVKHLTSAMYGHLRSQIHFCARVTLAF